MSQDGLPILETVDLEAGYSDVNILHGVSISVPRGSIVSVIGPNGAGKSTLLKTLYGLLPSRKGRVVFRPDGAEHDITGLKPNRITALGMNYVPQLDNVFPSMSVHENLELGAFLRPDRTRDQLEKVFGWFPLLRELLLLDEPSAGLAPVVVDAIFQKIREINESGISMVMIEQNARRSLALSHYAYVLDMGRNRFSGPGRDLLHDETVVDLYLGGRGRLAAAAALAGDDYEAAGETG
jgi:ABC-type branched-subunit amino acid transport system ATPase component